MGTAPNQVGSYNSLGDARSSNIWAILEVKDVYSGDEWKVPITDAKVTYTMNTIPEMVATMPIGEKVAENRLRMESGDANDLTAEFVDQDHPPPNDKFYEVRLMANLNSDRMRWPGACLFRGMVDSTNLVDASQVPSGRRSVKMQASGSVALLRNINISSTVSKGIFTSGGDNAWGQNAQGEWDGTMAQKIGGGEVSVPDMLEHLIAKTCDQHINIQHDAFDRPYYTSEGGQAHAATTAKWVMVNMLRNHGRYDWGFDVSGGDRAAAQLGIQIMELMKQGDSDVWSFLKAFSQQFDLSIVCGVNKFIIAPILRPTGIVDMTLTPEEVTHVSSNGKPPEMRGMTIMENQMVPRDGDLERAERLLTSRYWKASQGPVPTISTEGRFPWLRFADNPREVARKIAEQHIIDGIHGSTTLSLQVPYIHETLPGTMMKVEDVHAFDTDIDVGDFTGHSYYDKKDVYGLVNSVQLNIKSSGEQTLMASTITLTHACNNHVMHSIAREVGDHIVSDSAFHNFKAEYEEWDDNEFTPSGSESEYPTGMEWDVGDYLDPFN